MKFDQYQYREALRDFLNAQQFRYHLTFTFCRDIRYPAARDKLLFWSGRTMRRLWGRGFYRLDPKSTLFYVAFPEYGANGDNFHFHALARIDESRTDSFEEVARRQWRLVVPSGDLFLQRIGDTESDLAAVVGYDTKALDEEKIYLLSTEFASFDVALPDKYQQQLIHRRNENEAR